MSGLNFDEQRYINDRIYSGDKTGIAAWMIRKGIVENAKQATYILIGTIIVCILIILFILSRTGSNDMSPNDVSDIYPEDHPDLLNSR